MAGFPLTEIERSALLRLVRGPSKAGHSDPSPPLPSYEIAHRQWQFQLVLTAQKLARDFCADVLDAAIPSVEGHYPQRTAILPGQQITNDGLQVGLTIQHQIDGSYGRKLVTA
jgi:hypothetical protein